MNQMTTLLRRELWEHRSIFAVPTVFGGLFVLAAILGIFGLVKVGLDGDLGGLTLSELAEQVKPQQWAPGMEVLFASVAVTLQMVMGFIIFFYLVDALYAERRDRSILFWKSLPVTDTKVVGSKFLTAAAVIPGVTIVVFLLTAVLLWLIAGLTVLFAGTGEALAAGPVAIVKTVAFIVYWMIVQALWYAPLYGWLLLASAFAKRAVLLWAVLPPVVVIVAEEILFSTERFAELLGQRVVGGFELAYAQPFGGVGWHHGSTGLTALPPLSEFMTPGRLLASPELWAGLVVAAAFLAGAVWLRRWRDEA
jgi:ABC-2 type transport system permease protein